MHVHMRPQMPQWASPRAAEPKPSPRSADPELIKRVSARAGSDGQEGSKQQPARDQRQRGNDNPAEDGPATSRGGPGASLASTLAALFIDHATGERDPERQVDPDTAEG